MAVWVLKIVNPLKNELRQRVVLGFTLKSSSSADYAAGAELKIVNPLKNELRQRVASLGLVKLLAATFRIYLKKQLVGGLCRRRGA